jgi:hypothetical protein
MRNTYFLRKGQKGMATNFPAKYFNIDGMPQPSASAGSCLLKVTDTMVRPKIGGKRYVPPHIRRRRTQKRKMQTHKRRAQTQRKRRQQKGGFLPSIGEPFAAAAAKYIAPLALFGIYRFLNPTKKAGRSARRSARRSTRRQS